MNITGPFANLIGTHGPVFIYLSFVPVSGRVNELLKDVIAVDTATH